MPTSAPSADPPGGGGSQGANSLSGGPNFPCGPQNVFFHFDYGGFVKWTPSGSHILFDDRSTILSVDAGGSRLRTVVDANPEERFVFGLYADVSPDGARVAYTSCQYMTEGEGYWAYSYGGDDRYPYNRGKYMHEIATVAMDGSAPERLTDLSLISRSPPLNHYPVWSPDGKRIAFRGSAWAGSWFFNSYVKIMSADGSNQSDRIGPASRSVYTPPVWSPDGKSLAFVDNGGDGMLYTVSSDSTGLSAISEALGHVSWSPDSQRLALARQEGDDVVLVTIATDGSDPQTVTKIAGESIVDPLSWSPDGSHILYGCAAGVCVVDLDGNHVGQSPAGWSEMRDNPPRNTEYPEGRPKAAWSPDGSRIAIRPYSYPRPEGSAVVFTMAPDGADAQVLVRDGRSPVAANSGYEDVEFSIASCSEGFVVSKPEENDGLVKDCETLMGLRDALTGGTIINWSPRTPIDEWEGVVLGGSPTRVTGLGFDLWDPWGIGWEREDHYYLNGILPPELGDLEMLEVLSLRYNRLSGSIPPEVGMLSNLRVLELNGNALSGGIPPELGNLASLERLDLSRSALSGSVPPELGKLNSLRVLNLTDNALSGSIPPELGNLTSLQELDLWRNYWSGCIAAELPDLWVQATGLERCE